MGLITYPYDSFILRHGNQPVNEIAAGGAVAIPSIAAFSNIFQFTIPPQYYYLIESLTVYALTAVDTNITSFSVRILEGTRVIWPQYAANVRFLTNPPVVSTQLQFLGYSSRAAAVARPSIPMPIGYFATDAPYTIQAFQVNAPTGTPATIHASLNMVRMQNVPESVPGHEAEESS